MRGAWVRIPQTSFLNSFFDRRPPWWGKEGKAPVRPRRALALRPTPTDHGGPSGEWALGTFVFLGGILIVAFLC